MAEFSAVWRIPHQSGGCYFPSLLWNLINKGVINLVTPYLLLNCERQVQRSRFATFRIKGLQICGHPVIAHFCARWTFLTIVTCGNGSVPNSTGQGVCNPPHAANETSSVLTPYQLSSKRGQLRVGLRKNVKLFVTICAVSWKSAVCLVSPKPTLLQTVYIIAKHTAAVLLSPAGVRHCHTFATYFGTL